MRVNFLGFIGIVALILLVIFLCVRYIPGAGDAVKDIVDNTTDTTPPAGDETETDVSNDTDTTLNLNIQGVNYEFVW